MKKRFLIVFFVLLLISVPCQAFQLIAESIGGGGSPAQPDTTPPEVSTVSIDTAGTTLTVNFTEACAEGTGYSDSDWTLACSTTSGLTIAHNGGSASSWDFDITGGPVQVAGTDTCTLDWAGTADGVEDTSDNQNDLAAIDPPKAITNNSTQVPPAFVSATINADAAVITLSEDVVITGLDDGDFVMTGSTSGAVNLNSCSELSGVISCTAASEFVNGETVTLAYNGGADEVEDTTGLDLATFSGESVTNNTAAAGYSDDFSTTPFTARWGYLTSTQWTYGTGTVESANGAIYYKTALTTDNRYIKWTLVTSSDYTGAVLSSSGTGSAGFLCANVYDGSLYIESWDDGGWVADVDSLGAFSTTGGDVTIGMTICGTGASRTIRAWLNPTGNSPTSCSVWGGSGPTATSDSDFSSYQTGKYMGLESNATSDEHDNVYLGDIP